MMDSYSPVPQSPREISVLARLSEAESRAAKAEANFEQVTAHLLERIRNLELSLYGQQNDTPVAPMANLPPAAYQNRH
jgi:hypothetical protein